MDHVPVRTTAKRQIQSTSKSDEIRKGIVFPVVKYLANIFHTHRWRRGIDNGRTREETEKDTDQPSDANAERRASTVTGDRFVRETL